MKFDRLSNHNRRMILEHDSQTGLHNWTVATKALGVETAINRRNIQKRGESARLGVRLGALDITLPSDNLGTPPKFIDTKPVPFSRANALTLTSALVSYVHATADDLDYMVKMDPHRCNLRVIETDMAHLMLSQLIGEFGDILPAEKPVFGFH